MKHHKGESKSKSLQLLREQPNKSCVCDNFSRQLPSVKDFLNIFPEEQSIFTICFCWKQILSPQVVQVSKYIKNLFKGGQ